MNWMGTYWIGALLCLTVCGGCGDETTNGGLSNAGDTWTDPASSLTWQVNPTGGEMKWSKAKAHCSGLSPDGGGWRLPTIGELRSLIRRCSKTEASGSCNVEEGDCLALSCRDDKCEGCSFWNTQEGCYWPHAIDELEGECGFYWSSSPVEGDDDDAWSVAFGDGGVYDYEFYFELLVRCVR